MRSFYPYIFLIIVIILNACAPTTKIEKEKIASPDRLIIKVEANRRKIKNFVGSGIITVYNNELNAKSNFEVQLKKADSIKISFFGPFGIDLAEVLVSSNNFLFYDIINNKIYKGALKNDVLQKILKINLTFGDVIDALTGSVNLSDKLRKQPDQFEYEKGFYKLTYIDSINSIKKIYLINANNLSIAESSIHSLDGEKLIEGKYSNFQTIDNVRIPMEINLNNYRNKEHLKIQYKNISINNDLQFLKIEIPEDAKIIEW